ncbi:MAG: SsrA-binding protein SmpB [Betaproteobacteria bacterium]|nr:SsrA-binding protein SmpB [Betaproteobacteria bacterium]
MGAARAGQHSSDGQRTFALNRKASHNYSFEDRFEAGICLLGWEVRGIVEGRAQMSEARVALRRGEAYLLNCGISPPANIDAGASPKPSRSRKLLLRKSQLRRLIGRVQRSGYTLVPLSIYASGRKIKLEVALAKGKKRFDKRATLKQREQDREARRALKRRSRGG